MRDVISETPRAVHLGFASLIMLSKSQFDYSRSQAKDKTVTPLVSTEQPSPYGNADTRGGGLAQVDTPSGSATPLTSALTTISNDPAWPVLAHVDTTSTAGRGAQHRFHRPE